MMSDGVWSFLRILHLYARHHSWPGLLGRLWKAAARPLYERTTRIIVGLSTDAAVQEPPSNGVVELSPDRIGEMLEVMYVSRRGLHERFQRGERCFAVRDDRGIISYFWSQGGTKDWEEMHLRFRLRSNQAWLYNAITVKHARGKGLYPRVIHHIVRTLQREGISQYYVDVAPTNPAGVRSLQKTGFQSIALVRMTKVLSRIAYKVVVFDHRGWDELSGLIDHVDRTRWTVTEAPDRDGRTDTRHN